MEIFAIWTSDDEFHGSIKAYCKTRSKAEEELKNYTDYFCDTSPKPDDRHIIPIHVIEDEEVEKVGTIKKYLVATECGGLMEMPEIYYEKYDIIEAESPKEAEEKYDKKHKCSYFYGICIGEIDEEMGTVSVPIKHFIRNYKK